MKFDIHYLFSAKYAKWIIISFITLFSVLIIYEYANLFFSPAIRELPVVSMEVRQTTKQDLTHYFLNAPLFGVYVPNDLNENNVKKSVLNVTIAGILLGDKPENSQVIVRSESGEEKSYKMGDTLPGDAVIERIMATGILVKRNGALESLSFPKNDLIFEPVAKPLKEE